MRLLDYASVDITQDITQQATIPQIPIAQAPTVRKIKMTWGRRQFWLHFAVVTFFLFVETCALVTWGIVSNGAILPPFVEKTPIVAPCAHIRIYVDPTQNVLQRSTDESCH